MSVTIHPFNQIERAHQREILNKLQESNPFKSTFKALAPSALKFIKGELTEINEEALCLAKAMNAEAEEIWGPQDFQKHYQPWKTEVDVLTGLFPIANEITKGLMYGSLAMGGISLWSFRSSKLLAVANGCVTVALLFFSRAVESYAFGFYGHYRVLKELNVQNRNEFSSKIDQNYQRIAKSSKLLQYYFTAKKHSFGVKEHQGILLLREDIAAIKAMRSYARLAYVALMSGTPIEIPSEKLVNLSQIKGFFRKLERTFHQGKNLAALGTLMGMSYFYCAYVNRAYLMMIAGLTFSLMNGVLFAVACSYKIGVGEMQKVEDHNLLELFNCHVSGRLIPKAEDPISLQEAIVIPLERILKLIPF